ncbi:MAG: hypothetical protein HQL51_14520 [Magnetococcales bacterium]|nr:hypothetical protein [Magnetococcales bacterium]
MAEIQPIGEERVPEVCAFLHRHLNARIPEAGWRRALLNGWDPEPPHHGFCLMDGHRLVGVVAVIFSRREIGGREVRLCNPTGWVVLPEYRAQAVQLFWSVYAQPGVEYLVTSHMPLGARLLALWKFRPIPGCYWVTPNLPRPASGRVETQPEALESLLPEPLLTHYRRHRPFGWLRHAVVTFTPPATSGEKREGGEKRRALEVLYVIYRTRRWKRAPSVEVLYVSDGGLYLRGAARLARHFLLREGCLVTRVEQRFLPERPALALEERTATPRAFCKSSLSDAELSNLYTEVLALDIEV